MNYLPIVILATGGIILTVGDLVMKKWVNTNSTIFYVIGLFIWIIGLLFLAEGFKFKNIAVASLIFNIINIVTLVIFSWVYFKENLSTTEMIGIFLGILAIILLEIGNK